MYKIEKVQKLNKVQLRRWQELWEKTPDVHFFNSAEYFIAFLDVFPEREYLIFYCYKDNELIGVLPLVWGYRFGIKTLMCPDGFGGSIDRSSLCINSKDPVAFSKILESVSREGNVFLAELEKHFLNLIIDNKKRVRKLCNFEFSCYSPRLVFGSELLVNFSKKAKKKFYKKLKRADNEFVFEFHRKSKLDDFQKMIEVEKNSWKGQKGISLFEKENARRIYSSWIKTNNKNVGVAFLKSNDKEVAYLFGVFAKDTFLITNTAFDIRFGKFTPGTVLVFHVLEYLKSKDVKIVDFSVGDSRWKRDFGSDFLKQYNFYFSKNKTTCLWWKICLFFKGIVKKTLSPYRCRNK